AIGSPSGRRCDPASELHRQGSCRIRQRGSQAVMRFRLLTVAAILSAPAFALPTMIRLGYPNCVSCHISPQGGGLLNDYGRGIDQAQSFQGGEYRPAEGDIWRILNWDGR